MQLPPPLLPNRFVYACIFCLVHFIQSIDLSAKAVVLLYWLIEFPKCIHDKCSYVLLFSVFFPSSHSVQQHGRLIQSGSRLGGLALQRQLVFTLGKCPTAPILPLSLPTLLAFFLLLHTFFFCLAKSLSFFFSLLGVCLSIQSSLIIIVNSTCVPSQAQLMDRRAPTHNTQRQLLQTLFCHILSPSSCYCHTVQQSSVYGNYNLFSLVWFDPSTTFTF